MHLRAFLSMCVCFQTLNLQILSRARTPPLSSLSPSVYARVCIVLMHVYVSGNVSVLSVNVCSSSVCMSMSMHMHVQVCACAYLCVCVCVCAVCVYEYVCACVCMSM